MIVSNCDGHSEFSRALVERGADVNAVNGTGAYALVYAKSAALRDGNYAVMDLLIRTGADDFR